MLHGNLKRSSASLAQVELVSIRSIVLCHRRLATHRNKVTIGSVPCHLLRKTSGVTSLKVPSFVASPTYSMTCNRGTEFDTGAYPCTRFYRGYYCGRDSEGSNPTVPCFCPRPCSAVARTLCCDLIVLRLQQLPCQTLENLGRRLRPFTLV